MNSRWPGRYIRLIALACPGLPTSEADKSAPYRVAIPGTVSRSRLGTGSQDTILPHNVIARVPAVFRRR
jgi:hypothetical protein